MTTSGRATRLLRHVDGPAVRRIPSTVVMERPATPIGPIGFVLPTFPQDTPLPGAPPSGRAGADFDPIGALASICTEAEQLGAGALWACDHLFWHGPTLDCLTTLTLAATATRAGGARHLCPAASPSPAECGGQAGGDAADPQPRPMHPRRGRRPSSRGVRTGRCRLPHPRPSARHRHRRTAAVVVRRTRAGRRRWTGAGVALPAVARATRRPGVGGWVLGGGARRAARLGDGWLPLFLEPARYRQDLDRLAEDVATGRPSAGLGHARHRLVRLRR